VPPDEDARLMAELANSHGDPWCGMACCTMGSSSLSSATVSTK
jgi:hypothetical protein